MKTVKELYGGEVVIEFNHGNHSYYLTKDGEELPKKVRLSGATTYTGVIDKSAPLMHWACNQFEAKLHDILGMQVEDKEAGLVSDENMQYQAGEVYKAICMAKGAHREKKEEAATIGDYVHKWAEEYAKDEDYIVAYQRVCDEMGRPGMDIEETVKRLINQLNEWFKENEVEFIAAEQMIYSRKLKHSGTFDAIVRINGKVYLVDYKTSNGVYPEHFIQSSSYMKAKEEEMGHKYFDGALIISIPKNGEDVIPKFRTRGQLVKDYKAFKALVAVKNRLKEIGKE